MFSISETVPTISNLMAVRKCRPLRCRRNL
jgi:hypothetical protein